MDDLISRKAAIEHIEAEYQAWGDEYDVRQILGDLEDLPSAQPEVIRCKDCKYWDTTWQNDDAPNYHYCPMLDGIREDDFYCADAERRTDE